jgi:hypothetical protein
MIAFGNREILRVRFLVSSRQKSSIWADLLWPQDMGKKERQSG